MSTAVTAHPGGLYDLDVETFVVAPTLAGGGRKSGGYSLDDIPVVAATLTAQYGKNGGIPAGKDCTPVNLIAGTLQASGKAAGSATQQDAESGLLVVHGTQDPNISRGCAHTLGRNNGQENALLAFTQNSRSEVRQINGDGQIIGALAAEAGAQQQNYLAGGSGVRRLTPRECERLQGFPDDYTLIPWRGKPAEECPDGPRYKAIGNSKAIPVVRWIGKRMAEQLRRPSN